MICIVRGHNMQMRTVCLDSVDNVQGLTVRYPRPIRGLMMWVNAERPLVYVSSDKFLLSGLFCKLTSSSST